MKNKRIQAHKIILASRSEYFDRLVFGNMKERDLEEIEIKEVENVDLFEDILEYAYTGSITITGDIQVRNGIGRPSPFFFYYLCSILRPAPFSPFYLCSILVACAQPLTFLLLILCGILIYVRLAPTPSLSIT